MLVSAEADTGGPWDSQASQTNLLGKFYPSKRFVSRKKKVFRLCLGTPEFSL